ncbi:MAG: N-6 DNA methylase [Nitrospirae bacterium]|nr:N-6 DNA methylase [Nitrospirota bacterium]MBF0534086.1 N-6 DNA methylase [Nitrospirota bacterium]MBF0616245.1 N-6 DNA methylase [Nitrospirota bacterium]
MLEKYLTEISEIYTRGDAREESYYSVLENLLRTYCDAFNKTNVEITSQPKQTEAGNPDFRVWDGLQSITGYIEAKEPTVVNLDRIEQTPQLKRYLSTFPNMILTNFLEFRLYRNGLQTDKVTIGRPVIMQTIRKNPPLEMESEFLALLEKFFSFSIPKIYSPKTLAVELAKRTRFLRDEVIEHELKKEGKFISGFYKAFKDYLIGALSESEFSDLYAQTVTYGLFVAKTRSKNGFNRKLAYDNIPKTIGILRDIFRFVSSLDLPPDMQWTIDDISEVLAVTDINMIFHQYYHEGKGHDPIVHFYETFLTAYDPKTREMRGVYYTPEPVVSYIVRSINTVLKEKFNKPDAMADRSVTVLDPAAGTLTFLAEAAKLAVNEFASRYGDGGKENFIKEHILKNFFAFELMMAPYAVGHIKMSFMLEELGYVLKDGDRVKLYLTNTLEMEALKETELPLMSSLSEESHLAGEIKDKQPILIILGNPPYSGHSSNVGKWIKQEIKAYFTVDGKPLNERNPKWLQDDYVKFIRFAQWKIDKAGEGVLGFITNHSYLDTPTFRGMRQSLMNSFDEIYILDLHGSSQKKEKCPDGSKDENVFDIKQGVAIAIFIKTGKKTEKSIYHSELWGNREHKSSVLMNNDIKTTKWEKLDPARDFYLFMPRNESLWGIFDKFIKVTDIFPVNSVGVVTARDDLTIKWTKEELLKTVLNFVKLEPELARQAYDLGNDTRDWKVGLAQNDLMEGGLDKNKIVPILYRPFDVRYTYYTGNSRGFHCMPRVEVMQHMVYTNIGLLTCRQQNKAGFHHAFISNEITESCVVSNATREINYLFPLYIYPDRGKGMLFEVTAEGVEKQPNIDKIFHEKCYELYGNDVTPEEIFNYIYAILYSETYRVKYAGFLKTDFPKIPFTNDREIFKRMSEYGRELADLHLLNSPELNTPSVRFQGKGDSLIEKITYDDETSHVYINKTQYFEGMDAQLWNYQIGSYRVCCKWLKDRTKRVLLLDEIQMYCKIATAVKMTIKLQHKIDKIYEEIELSCSL